MTQEGLDVGFDPSLVIFKRRVLFDRPAAGRNKDPSLAYLSQSSETVSCRRAAICRLAGSSPWTTLPRTAFAFFRAWSGVRTP
jgi:hypothetical protein